MKITRKKLQRLVRRELSHLNEGSPERLEAHKQDGYSVVDTIDLVDGNYKIKGSGDTYDILDSEGNDTGYKVIATIAIRGSYEDTLPLRDGKCSSKTRSCQVGDLPYGPENILFKDVGWYPPMERGTPPEGGDLPSMEPEEEFSMEMERGTPPKGMFQEVTLRQLRRIVEEEKKKVLNESIHGVIGGIGFGSFDGNTGFHSMRPQQASQQRSTPAALAVKRSVQRKTVREIEQRFGHPDRIMKFTKRHLRMLIREEIQSLSEQPEKRDYSVGHPEHNFAMELVETYFHWLSRGGGLQDVAPIARRLAELSRKYSPAAVSFVVKDMADREELEALYTRVGGAQGVGTVIDAIAEKLQWM